MPSLPSPGEQVGPYRVDDRLGMGGMGVVFRATHAELGMPVALKVIAAQLAETSEFVTRFRREADVMARLDSPHVVEILDHGTTGEALYLATQLVPGGDLGSLLRTRGPLSPHRAARLCAQVAHALDAAHEAGVVHRDVKPSNVLLHDIDGPRLHGYLCDFGIAQPDDAEGLTQTGGIAGSWGYLAPERTQGHPATPASDIYAVGCLLWACLSGAAPYGGSEVQVVMAHLNAPIPQLPGDAPISRALNQVLRDAMAKDPARRPSSAGALRDALRAVGQVPASGYVAPPLPAADTPTTHRPAPVVRRRRGLVVGVAAAAVLALVGGGVAWWALGGDEETTPPAGAQTATGINGDVDGDGLGDVVAEAGASQYELMTWRSTGDGLEEPTGVESEVIWTFVADMDGDGVEDRVGVQGRRVNTTVTWTDADGAEHSAVATFRRATTFSTQLVGDFTGDGRADVALVAPLGRGDSERVEFWVAEGDGESFAEPELWLNHNGWASGISDQDYRVADLDGDGTDDVVRTHATGRVHFLRSTGSSFVVERGTMPLSRPGYREDVVPADLDGDGRDELVQIDPDGTVRVHAWERPFTPRAVYEGEAPWTDGGGIASTSDVDGDGDDDLVVVTVRDDVHWTINVMLSDGDALGEPTGWAEVSGGSRDDPYAWLRPVGGPQ